MGTMGRNLLLNIADHGHSVVGFNRSQSKLDLLEQEKGELDVWGSNRIADFVQHLRFPRAVLLLVPAGEATDEMIDEIVPFLSPGDVLIDGGNAHFADTERRSKALAAKQILFIGLGVSGGEEGARFGPSMMAGGSKEAYSRVGPVLEQIAAKVDGEPCVALLGPRSAGHFVKTVHNGIEYGIMQILAETYDLMKRGLGLGNAQIGDAFAAWTETEMGGFLLEITRDVFRTPGDLLDLVLDRAKGKGTGKWTSQIAMDMGVPIPTIDAAVASRNLSDMKPERVAASALATPVGNVSLSLEQVEQALYAAIVSSYAQGLSLLRKASEENAYDLDLATVCKIWRGGCIIRSRLLEPFRAAFAEQPGLANLLVSPAIHERVASRLPGLRAAVSEAAQAGIPMLGHASALAYVDSYTAARLPANLIQAQRDYFGAHTYERVDQEGSFHSKWGPGA